MKKIYRHRAILTASWVELIDKHKFVQVVFDEGSKTFVVHVSALKVLVLIFTICFMREPLLAALK